MLRQRRDQDDVCDEVQTLRNNRLPIKLELFGGATP